MKNFIYKTGLFIGIFITAIILLVLLEEDRENSTEFMAAMVDKHRRLESIAEPTLILAGGSNLVFGVDSEQLEQNLHMPVTNLGLRAHLGLNFILNEVKDVVKKGDIVVLSLEYFMDMEGEHDLHLLSSYYHSSAIDYCTEHQQGLGLFLDYRHMMFKKFVTTHTTKNQETYARTDFNKYGDGIKHLRMQNPSIQGSRYVIDANKDEEIEVLNAFYEYAQREGFKVVYAYSPYEQDEYQKNIEALKSLDKDLRVQMKIKLITSLEDFTYPNAMFFDNVYHLNAAGRKSHTEKLIRMLRKELPVQLAIR